MSLPPWRQRRLTLNSSMDGSAALAASIFVTAGAISAVVTKHRSTGVFGRTSRSSSHPGPCSRERRKAKAMSGEEGFMQPPGRLEAL